MTTCRSEDEYADLLARPLPPGELDELTAHLAACEQCGETVDRLWGDELIADALRGQPTDALGPPGPAIDLLLKRVKSLGVFDTMLSGRPVTRPAFLDPPAGPGELGRLGDYRVLREIGAGGMGVVFLAEDTLLHRMVALKVVRPEAAVDSTVRQRFLREARSAAAVTHDHVVTVYQVGLAGEVPFLAMQLLEGRTLQSWLEAGRPLGVARAMRVAREAAEGLAAAHARGLIHRDIKPSNLWIEEPSGRVKILDFGLAKPVAGAEELTHASQVVGTPGYMPPEQTLGDGVDARTDLFGLGAVLYRMLTGRLPFTGADAQDLMAAAHSQTPPPVRSLNPRVPEDLAALTEKLLAKETADRPQSAAEVAKTLLALERRLRRARGASATEVPLPRRPVPTDAELTLTPVPSARPAAPPTTPAPARIRRRWRGWAALAAGVVLAAGGAGLWFSLPPPDTGLVIIDQPGFGEMPPILIERDGQPVEEVSQRTGERWRYLPAGHYTLRMGRGGEGWRVVTDRGEARFEMRVKDRIALRVFGPNGPQRPQENGPSPRPAPPEPPRREVGREG